MKFKQIKLIECKESSSKKYKYTNILVNLKLLTKMEKLQREVQISGQRVIQIILYTMIHNGEIDT